MCILWVKKKTHHRRRRRCRMSESERLLYINERKCLHLCLCMRKAQGGCYIVLHQSTSHIIFSHTSYHNWLRETQTITNTFICLREEKIFPDIVGARIFFFIPNFFFYSWVERDGESWEKLVWGSQRQIRRKKNLQIFHITVEKTEFSCYSYVEAATLK